VGGQKEMLLEGEKDQCMSHTHTHIHTHTHTPTHTYEDSIMKPTKHCFKTGRRDRTEWNIMVGMNMFKVHCIHLWNYHND
jgi:hypothetical protein